MSKVIEFRRKPTATDRLVEVITETLGELGSEKVKGVVMAVVLDESAATQAVFYRYIEDGYHLYVAGAAAQLAYLVTQPVED